MAKIFRQQKLDVPWRSKEPRSFDPLSVYPPNGPKGSNASQMNLLHLKITTFRVRLTTFLGRA
jgi:hypothetical protein